MDLDDHPMAHGQAMRRPLHEALVAAHALFSDTSVDREETASDLRVLAYEIEVMLDSFP